MKYRILFVDDQPEILDGLRRVLRHKRDTWEMQFCGSAAEALAVFEGATIHVLVTDMRMPGFDGARLCEEVMQRSPDTIRMILSGQSDNDQIFRAFGKTHRYLSKPCPPELLIEAIDDAILLQDLINQKPSLSLFVSRSMAIPCDPVVLSELQTQWESIKLDMPRIMELVAADMAICCQLLHLANTAFHGQHVRMESLTDVFNLVGAERVKQLVMEPGLFLSLNPVLPAGLDLAVLQKFSLSIGFVAGEIMRREFPQNPELINKAFVAGVTHDIGQLILLHSRPEDYWGILQATRNIPERLCHEERKLFGVTHSEVGANLLRLWGMDTDIVDAVAHHHDPDLCLDEKFTVLTALQLAEALVHESAGSAAWPFGNRSTYVGPDEPANLRRLNEWRGFSGQLVSGASA